MELDFAYFYQVFGEAAALYFRGAPEREIRLAPHSWMVASGIPYADFNNVFIDQGSAEQSPVAENQLRDFHAALQARNLPALYLFTPSVVDQLAPIATELGMMFAGQMPVMVCPAAGLPDTASDQDGIQRVETGEQLAAACDIVVAAFTLPSEPMRRAMGVTMLDGPGLTIYLAYEAGQPVSTITITEAGPFVGVWAMATLPEYQRKGIGRNLITYVMARHNTQRAKYFYLWSTEAGNHLYEQIGFRTVVELSVWATGQTVQVH